MDITHKTQSSAITDNTLLYKKPMPLSEEIISILRCPRSGAKLIYKNCNLQTSDGKYIYKIDDNNIPYFAENFISDDAKIQQQHFDRVAKQYVTNLEYPHTQEYMQYLDKKLITLIDYNKLEKVGEVCCGTGEAFNLLRNKIHHGIGIDISTSMLLEAKKLFSNKNYTFLQGDATNIPLQDNSLSSIFMLGGIHHINNRQQLFNEIFRILKPGGKFYWREPASDFFLWRWLRHIIYRLSSALDADTEKPLRYKETIPLLKKAGFENSYWETFGLLGFCFFMNSDILVFNRFFRFIPKIRAITRFFVKIDDLMIKFPLLKNAGLQVVGYAQKPKITN